VAQEGTGATRCVLRRPLSTIRTSSTLVAGGGEMDAAAMNRLFRTHREAEAARDFDGIIATFTDDCYLDTVPLGRRTAGRDATRTAYEAMFTAFPDLAPDDEGSRSPTT
jgi:hypothetical protein